MQSKAVRELGGVSMAGLRYEIIVLRGGGGGRVVGVVTGYGYSIEGNVIVSS